MGHMLKPLPNWCYSLIHAKTQFFRNSECRGTDASTESVKDLTEMLTLL